MVSIFFFQKRGELGVCVCGKNRQRTHPVASMVGGSKKEPPPPVVECVTCEFDENGGKIAGLQFSFLDASVKSPPPSSGTSVASSNRAFVLQAPFEYVVCVRYDALEDGTLTGVQVQTNLGRRSRLFRGSLASMDAQLGNRHELFAPQGQAVTGLEKQDVSYVLNTVSEPVRSQKKLRKMVLLSSVRRLVLSSSSEHHQSSVARNMFRGGRKAAALHAVRNGLAGKLFSVDEEGDALIRLILEGEEHTPTTQPKRRSSLMPSTFSMASLTHRSKVDESTNTSLSNDDVVVVEDDDEEDGDEDGQVVHFPPSVIRAMCDRNAAFPMSLMDMYCAGRERDGRTPLIRLFFESGFAKLVFARNKKSTKPSLAQQFLTPDRKRGLRSLMQLLTDEEANEDVNRPSVMRSLLAGEETGDRPSIMRIMFIKTPGRCVYSIFDSLLSGEQEKQNSIVRRLFTEGGDRKYSLARYYFSDTPSGKPSLAKYVFGGECEYSSSLMRLMVQGEARNQNSLLRLLVSYPGPKNRTLLDLLTTGYPSIVDIMLMGEDTSSELSLFRIFMGTTFTIENGEIVMGSILGDTGTSVLSIPTSKLSTSLGEADSDDTEKERFRKKLRKGLTLAKAYMLGEEDGGPGISIMRILLMGEEQGSSVLRLLLTGEAEGEVSPLRIIYTGLHTAFIAVEQSRKEVMAGGGVKGIMKDPSKWTDALKKITNAMKESVNQTHQNTGTWKESFDKLMDMAKQQAFENTGGWQGNVAFMWTAVSRIRSMGPEFAKNWERQFKLVAREIEQSGERVNSENKWKQLAPYVAKLAESVAVQQWQTALLDAAQVLKAVEVVAGRGQEDSKLKSVLEKFEYLAEWAPRWF